MCSHSEQIKLLIALIAELQSRKSTQTSDQKKISHNSLQEKNFKLLTIEKPQDHRVVCSNIDGCDTTR
jgi:hypothetical protein